MKFEYNYFGQLTTEYQDHDAVINEQATPKVGYSYASGADNHVRPTKITYPNGRELNFNYGTTGSFSDYLSRVAALVVAAAVYETYVAAHCGYNCSKDPCYNCDK